MSTTPFSELKKSSKRSSKLTTAIVPFFGGLAALGAFSSLNGCGAFDPSGRTPGMTRVLAGGSQGSEANGAAKYMNAAARNAGTNPVLPGGITLFFQGVNGTTNTFSYFMTNDQASFDQLIPNGTYQIYALGYNQPDTLNANGTALKGLQGDPKCGYATASGNPGNITLAGTDTTVAFAMSTENCKKLPFNQDTTLQGNLLNLVILPCYSGALLSGVLSSTSLSGAATACNGSYIGGAIVEVIPYTSDTAGSIAFRSDEGIEAHHSSGCIGRDGSYIKVPTLPSGVVASSAASSTMASYLRVTTFADSACQTLKGTYDFRYSILRYPESSIKYLRTAIGLSPGEVVSVKTYPSVLATPLPASTVLILKDLGSNP